jgi:FtsH-binding integral membrane protein
MAYYQHQQQPFYPGYHSPSPYGQRACPGPYGQRASYAQPSGSGWGYAAPQYAQPYGQQYRQPYQGQYVQQFQGQYAQQHQGQHAPAKPYNYDIESGYGKQYQPQYTNHPNLRNAFLRKVYTILFLQLALTVGIAGVCSWHEPTQALLLTNLRGFMWGSMLGSIAILVALSCGGLQYSHPINAILLFLFTLCESVAVGTVCTMYSYMGMADIVIGAGGITLGIFAALSAYVHMSKKDFSFMGGFLMMGLVVMIGWGLLNMIFGYRPSFIYSALGALLFCGFILFDTSQIMLRYGVDDYIPACISLYVDIIQLFFHILRLLAPSDNSR